MEFTGKSETSNLHSFTDLLARDGRLPKFAAEANSVPHGTTIVGLIYRDGLLMAGDRRAVAGGWVAARDIEKVFAADATSVIGVAGTAGIAQELVKLFRMELEHYEKISGQSLSLEGRANRLAVVLRMNLDLAFNDLGVIPLYGGFDAQRGRLFSYDVVGGRYEDQDFSAVGSGAVFAKSSLKRSFDRNADFETACLNAVTALAEAADEDLATGGADRARDLWPIVFNVTAAGVSRVPDAEVKRQFEHVEKQQGERWSR